MDANNINVAVIPASGPNIPPVTKSLPTKFKSIKLPTETSKPLTLNPNIFLRK